MTTTQPTELDLACQALREAKARLDAARLEVANAETSIIDMIGTKGDEGTKTEQTEYFKVSTTAKLNRMLDANKLKDVAGQLPGDVLQLAIDYKPAINLRGLRAIEQANPDAYRILANAITVKPAKTSVKIDIIEHKQEAA